MPVDSRGYQLTPDIIGALSGGIRTGSQLQQLMQLREEQRKQEEIKRLLSGVGQPSQGVAGAQPVNPVQVPQYLNPNTVPQGDTITNLLSGVATQQPVQQAAQQHNAPAQNLLTQEQLIQQARQIDPILAEQTLTAMGMDSASKRAEASRFAAQVESLPPQMQNEAILERAKMLQSQGRDPKDTLQLLQMNPEERAVALQGVQMLDLATKDRFSVQASIESARGRAATANKVQSSEILPDGTTIQVLNDGSTRVTDSSGNELKGGDRAKAIKAGQDYGIDIQQMRSQARGTGAVTSKRADDLYNQVQKMEANSDNLRQLIVEVKNGANSGPLINMLPTLTSASQRLLNIKNRLGLDVVGSVTFGALSEKELKLAQQTAVPDLPPNELVKWAEEKIIANEKLSSYLSEQAAFLEKPGNTRGMWTEFVKSKSASNQQTQNNVQGTAKPVQQVGKYMLEVEQ